jgi:hypothetical protein
MDERCRAWRCIRNGCQSTRMEKKTTSSEDELRSQDNLRTIRVAPRSDRTALPANDSHEGNTPLGEVRVKVKLTNGAMKSWFGEDC